MTTLRRLPIKSEVSEKCVRAFERLIFSISIGIDPACSSIHHRIHASRTLNGRIDRRRGKITRDHPRISHKSIPPLANNYVTRGSNGGDSAPFIFVIQQTSRKKSRRRWFRLGDGESRVRDRLHVAEVIGEPIKAGSTVAHRSRIAPPALPVAGWQQWKCSITRSLCN